MSILCDQCSSDIAVTICSYSHNSNTKFYEHAAGSFPPFNLPYGQLGACQRKYGFFRDHIATAEMPLYKWTESCNRSNDALRIHCAHSQRNGFQWMHIVERLSWLSLQSHLSDVDVLCRCAFFFVVPRNLIYLILCHFEVPLVCSMDVFPLHTFIAIGLFKNVCPFYLFQTFSNTLKWILGRCSRWWLRKTTSQSKYCIRIGIDWSWRARPTLYTFLSFPFPSFSFQPLGCLINKTPLTRLMLCMSL